MGPETWAFGSGWYVVAPMALGVVAGSTGVATAVVTLRTTLLEGNLAKAKGC